MGSSGATLITSVASTAAVVAVAVKTNDKLDIWEMIRQLTKFHLTRKQPPKS